MTEDVFAFLKDELEKVGEETKDKVGDKYYTWSEHYNNWINIIQPLLQDASEFEKFNSLVIFRLMELQKQLLWILISVLYGEYHQAIRELRYVLDSMFQAFYLDKEHPDADIYCKLEIIKEIEREAYGGRLIDKLDLKYKAKLKELYSTLSKYVHSSYEELEPTIKGGKVSYRVTFTFDKDLFNKCADFTNKVMDVIYFVVFNRFPQLCAKVQCDAMTINSLKRFKCELSLKYLESTGKPRVK